MGNEVHELFTAIIEQAIEDVSLLYRTKYYHPVTYNWGRRIYVYNDTKDAEDFLKSDFVKLMNMDGNFIVKEIYRNLHQWKKGKITQEMYKEYRRLIHE